MPEWFAREYPKRGKVFVQTQDELGSINMLYGGAAAGFRVITSTSGPGWALMQEGMSHLAAAELPCVVVLVQRGGPGQGSVRHAQMDYLSVTRGGGQGQYRNIVLAPSSVQEVHDLVQLAFYLADKYRNPVVVLSDGIMGLIMESLEIKTIEFAKEIDPAVQEHRARHGTESSPEAANELGILYGRYGMLKEAWAQFSLSAKADWQFAWTNLGSVAFLRKDYPLALSYYRWALGLDPRDTAALLGVARSEYELEHFVEADAAYAELKGLDPVLAAKYGYLASMFGGEGRAWSFADRLSTTVWDEPSRLVLAPPQEAVTMSHAEAEQQQVEVAPAEVEPPALQAAPPVVAELPPDADLAPETAPTVSEELPVDADLAAIDVRDAPVPEEAPEAVAVPEPVAAPVEAVPVEVEPVEVAPVEVAPAEVAPAEAPPLEPPAPVEVASAPAVEEQPIPEAPVETFTQPESSPIEEQEAEIPQVAQEGTPHREGFAGALPILGTWTANPEAASQIDKSALFAKLAIPLAQARRPLRYTFTARSQGSG
ncbi:MAG: hypothetical protein NTU91_00935, partial [Chloroflexi bacterium]|nr:hypothetical protein [Chloroflexota bacterium]